MELEGGGHESCTPTGGRWNMATRADVHAGKQMDGQMDRWVSDGQNVDVVWWCWFPGRAFLNEFSQWITSCVAVQGAKGGSAWCYRMSPGKIMKIIVNLTIFVPMYVLTLLPLID